MNFLLEFTDGIGGPSTTGRLTPDPDKPRQKRGRPKKAAEAQEDASTGPTRPKRGRPPKKKAPEPEAGSSEESATEENDTETGTFCDECMNEKRFNDNLLKLLGLLCNEVY